MGRRIRYLPPNCLVEVSDTIIQNRYMLRPSADVNKRFTGVLGRAQRTYGMKICAVAVASNHYHLLLQPRDVNQLALFMGFFKSNLSKQIGGALHGWRGTMFAGRYHLIPVSDEETVQVGRLRYLLAHGVKEGLVDRTKDWPGIESGTSLISGRPLAGAWHSEKTTSLTGEREEVCFSPLPCWQNLSPSTWRRNVKEIVVDIDRIRAAERALSGVSAKGVEAVLSMPPLYRPPEPERTSMPIFHAASRQAWQAMFQIWSEVSRAYREAADALRDGLRNYKFPEGTYPPALPFVPIEIQSMTIGHSY